MMYDETDEESEQATDDALNSFTMFHDTYLSPDAPGHQAYLTYNERPVIFIFPKGGHTDWNRVREATDRWNPAPLLIYEDRPTSFAAAFDGFYAWINPGKKGWAADGSRLGRTLPARLLSQNAVEISRTRLLSERPGRVLMTARPPGALIDTCRSACGETFADTMKLWRQYSPPDQPLPFLLIATWNDYEEGTAIERGIPNCGSSSHNSYPPTSVVRHNY